jgi:hypothetical protein
MFSGISSGRPRLILILAVICASALSCSDDDDLVGPVEMPADFAVSRFYFGGTVSPRYHFDFDIWLSAADGDSISFNCDYLDGGEDDPPLWSYAFDVDQSAISDLYELMIDGQVLREEWDQLDDPPEGGSTRRLVITADGKSYEVPSWLANPTPLDTVYRAIDSLVPSEVWDTLWAKRERYIEEYPGSGH